MAEKKGVWRLKVTDGFSSSHQLRNYGGRCENLHGHNFFVEVVVEGEALRPDTGILMDFKDLKRELKTVLAELDHYHLNELPPFREDNPSSENIARHIYLNLQSRLPDGVAMVSVSVSEKDSSTAVYFERETP